MDNINNIEVIDLSYDEIRESLQNEIYNPLQNEICDPLQDKTSQNSETINDPLPDSNEINDPSPDPNMFVELYLFKSNESSNKKCKLSNPLRDYLVPSTSGYIVCCTLCEVSWKKSTGISTIKRHFKKFHKDIYDQLQEEIQRNKTIEPYGPNDEVKVKRITYLLINFRELINELDKQYRLPCRKTISNQVNAIYQTQQLNFLEDMINGSIEDTTPKLVATAMAIKLD
ncbi:18199_t:CDS:2, partial [Racocetra fulgida]